MSNFNDNILTVWLVQLGKLYYAGGLTREPYNDESFSFEFVKDEEVAFSILFEEIAEKIAEKCGGTVVKRELSHKELSKREDKHDAYMRSEGEIVEEVRKRAMLEHIQEQKKETTKKDKMVQIVADSFLLPFIHKGNTEFDYSNGVFYAGVVGERLERAEIQPKKETMVELIEKIAKADNQVFDSINPLIKVVQHPAVYMTAQLDTIKNEELNATILIKKECF
ncbi:hypothetical protein [Bacillus sp. M6-12]|uniref:hypothetical protein n=1 Tax=Bacillus sp. M6-12 TaxID=2054166 RepID=UPI0015E123B2|nr:hypothetical protein [Bacillus sp. M6-12]